MAGDGGQAFEQAIARVLPSTLVRSVTQRHPTPSEFAARYVLPRCCGVSVHAILIVLSGPARHLVEIASPSSIVQGQGATAIMQARIWAFS